MSFTLEQLETIHAKQRSSKIWIGSGLGIFLIVVFFTFAMLVDKAPPIFFKIEAIAAMVAIPMLFLLNHISFFFIQRRFTQSPYRELVSKLLPGDVDEKPEKVLGFVHKGRE